MPSIDVTMGDGATVDATMAGEAIAVEVNGAGYTDRQARDALDGETVTPGQVGAENDRTTAYHDSTDTQEVLVGSENAVSHLWARRYFRIGLSQAFLMKLFTL